MLVKRMLCVLMTLIAAFAVPFFSLASQGSAAVYSDGDSGEAVLRIQIRLRELGYLSYRPTGAYRAMTVEAVKNFQTRCGNLGRQIAIDGRMGPETMALLFDPNAPRVRIPDSVRMPRGPIADRLAVKGALLSWSEVKPALTAGTAYTVTDCNTGERFRLVFTGGKNHAEMELFSEEDKPAFDTVCGGEYNFLKRPVVVNIAGADIAASMQCAPHGSGEASNGALPGHVCVFFSGSLSHVGSVADIEHEAVVKQAAKQP